MIELQTFRNMDSFSILPLKLDRKEVFFKRFLGDEGLDENGDGLIDKIVLTIELDSEYNGIVTIQSDLDGAPYSIAQQFELKKGKNLVKYFIDGKRLLEFGINGPYEFINFHLFKENPFCRGSQCTRHVKAAFRVFFDNYLSKEYQLNEFSPRKL